MNQLEELITQTLTAYSSKAPEAAGVIDALHAKTQHPTSGGLNMRRLVPAVMVALVAAIALVATTHRGPSLDRPIVAHPGGGPAIPDGMQPVSFHGVQIFVPQAWKLGATRCGTPIADTVISQYGGLTPACLIPSVPGLTVAYLATSLSEDGRNRATVATEPVVIDGHAGRRGVGRPKNEPYAMSVLVLDDPGVVVAVSAPNIDEADRILDSTRVTPVDSYGCIDRVDPLVPAGPSDRDGASDMLVPGSPQGGVLCRYSDNWLARSIRLRPDQTHDLIDTLNALPEGTTSTGGGESQLPETCPEDRARGFVIRFTYASGPSVDVFVHIGGCEDLSATNGSRTTKINETLAMTLVPLAGYDGGVPYSFFVPTPKDAAS